MSLCLQRGVPPLGQEPQREQRHTGQVADEHEVQAERDQADVSDVLKVIDLHRRRGAAARRCPALTVARFRALLSSGSPAASVARPRWTGAKNAGFLCTTCGWFVQNSTYLLCTPRNAGDFQPGTLFKQGLYLQEHHPHPVHK